jgi:uncharacterized protein
MFLAVYTGNLKSVKVLTEHGASLDTSTYDGVTPLYMAAQQGYLEIVVLIEHDKSITNDIATPLFIAVQQGHLDIVKILIEHGASIDKASNGTTPLFIAALSGHLEIVKVLLEHGASIDKFPSDGTPLFIATHEEHLEEVILFCFSYFC